MSDLMHRPAFDARESSWVIEDEWGNWVLVGDKYLSWKEVQVLQSRVAELEEQVVDLKDQILMDDEAGERLFGEKKALEAENQRYKSQLLETENYRKIVEKEHEKLEAENKELKDYETLCVAALSQRDEARAQIAAARRILKEPDPTEGFSIGLKSLKKRLEAALGEEQRK